MEGRDAMIGALKSIIFFVLPPLRRARDHIHALAAENAALKEDAARLAREKADLLSQLRAIEAATVVSSAAGAETHSEAARALEAQIHTLRAQHLASIALNTALLEAGRCSGPT